jgi:hypothetical protein
MDMVTNEEASDIVIQNLKSKGFDVVSRDNIIADIKSIRERKIKGTKEITDKWNKI